MGMAVVLSTMPEMLERTLSEHVADGQDRCQACRDANGVSAAWPCVIRGVAEEARYIQNGGLPGSRHGRHRSAAAR